MYEQLYAMGDFTGENMMGMKRTILATITLCLLWSFGLRLDAQEATVDMLVDGVPLPSDLTPAADLNGPFTGVWVGMWDGQLKTILIVEENDDGTRAKVVYAIADNPNARFKRAWPI